MKHLLETKTSWKRRTRIIRENEENLADGGRYLWIEWEIYV